MAVQVWRPIIWDESEDKFVVGKIATGTDTEPTVASGTLALATLKAH